MHTSRSHAAGAHRFRVILPLSRSVSAFEYAALWLRAAGRSGWKIDDQAKDASRFWFLPGVVDDGPYECRRLCGNLLVPDPWLAEPEPVDPRTAKLAPMPRTRAPDQRDEMERTMRRASAYLAKMPHAISGAGGHAATWNAAIAVRGFGLNESEIFTTLWNEFNPRCLPPWSERELHHKAANAANARVPIGFKLDDDRPEWAPLRERYGRVPQMPPDPDPEYIPEPPDHEPRGAEPTPNAAPAREPGDDADEPPQSLLERHHVVTVHDAFVGALMRAQSREHAIGFTTGHYQLDDMLAGIRKGRIVTIGAVTSWGKSTFCTMIHDENEARGVRCMIVSAEDHHTLYENRLACRRARVNATRLRNGTCSEEDIRRLKAHEERANQTPFVYSAKGKSVEEVIKATRELIRGEGIELVMVDYLQCMRFRRSHADRRSEVTEVGRAFNDAITGSNAAGVFVSQLTRPPKDKPNYVPTMHDLKESGDLENESDHILLGFFKERHTNEEKRCVRIEKNKDGVIPDDDILMPWDDPTANFKTQAGAVMEHHEVSDDDIDDIIEDRRYV
jgi:hypothetical protein